MPQPLPPPIHAAAKRKFHLGLRRILRRIAAHDQRGATLLEWTLLLAAVVLPSYVMIRVGLVVLFEHYRLVTTLNGLPLP
ncbi:MAG: hypothetical protein AAGG38_07410 [Planctomycetota bacterium]